MSRAVRDDGDRHRHRGPEDRRPLPLLLAGGAAVVLLASLPVVGALTGLLRPAAAQTSICARGTTRLDVLASPDAAPVLRRLAAEFARTGQDSSGRCVDARVTAEDDSAATAALAQAPRDGDATSPDVWVPSASLWLSQLERQRRLAERSGSLVAPGRAPSIATSPLVVAMPRPMATALGWPKRAIGWKDLLQAARSPAGWGEHGHLEWGRFTLGETDPRTSQSGLEATIAAYAAAGGGGDLTLPDVYGSKARTFVAGVQQSVERFSSSDAEYLADVRRADDAGRGLTGVSALVTREELVVAYDRGTVGRVSHRPPRIPLVAIHPSDGVPVADHPYAVLRSSRVGPRERAAAAAFLHWLRTPEVQRRWQDEGFRDARGRPGTGPGTAAAGVSAAQPLKRMAVPGPQVVSAVLRSWSQLKKTANVINLIDVSDSMSEPAGDSRTSKLQAASDAARSAMQLFTDDDEVGLWTFSSGSAGRPDWQQVVPVGAMRERIDGATRRAAIDADLQRLEVRGGTALYSSIEAAYDEVHRRYRADRINAVVVLTDGHNNDRDGGPDLDALLKRLRSDPARPVRILTIAYGRDVESDVLNRIAAETGGAAYTASTTADIETAYTSVLSNF